MEFMDYRQKYPSKKHTYGTKHNKDGKPTELPFVLLIVPFLSLSPREGRDT